MGRQIYKKFRKYGTDYFIKRLPEGGRDCEGQGGNSHSRQVKPWGENFKDYKYHINKGLVVSAIQTGEQVDRLRKVLDNESLQRLAIETGFMERRSKLSPEVFFDLLFYASSLSQNSSLESLVTYLESKYGIVISKQSLDERFSEKAVSFVKRVLSMLIEEQVGERLYCDGFLSSFNQVRIKDSTKFNLPNNLAEHYRGSGGNATTSLAGISIQYEFDLKTGKILDLFIGEGIRNDQRDAGETSGNVCKNDLVIRDLGYYSVPVLQKIAAGEAFFLSRLQSLTRVYDENRRELDFKKLYASMSKNGIERCEKRVLIGEKKLPVRLIIGLVPEEVYQQRIRHKEKEEIKKGRKTKEQTKFLCRFNLFITNADEDQLAAEKVLPLYGFRWQVELMFKNWKSVFSIQRLQKMKENRYITMLYVRLILIVVNLQIINSLQRESSKGEKAKLLSYRKTLQTLKNSFSDILDILRSSREKAIRILAKIYRCLSKNHWREKRKNSENFCENIYLFDCVLKK
jgi:hypothetical protein